MVQIGKSAALYGGSHGTLMRGELMIPLILLFCVLGIAGFVVFILAMSPDSEGLRKS